MQITWFGHSCFRIATGTSVLLIDPFLKGNPTFEKANINWGDATNGVTHVALTHGHDDHIGDTGEICRLHGAILLATYELAMHMKGVGAENLEPMNTGGTIHTSDFSLTLTQALHSSSSGLNGGGNVYLGNPCGIVVRPKSGPTLYHMGDTDVFGDMALINELYKPSIGIVPIGDRFTMGAETAAFACRKYFEFKTVIPCHYATFGMLDPDAGKFEAAMRPAGITVPKVGLAFTV
jgi:L-ascorbate metabolism protein UlaG (beta-lactamase superfamily)